MKSIAIVLCVLMVFLFVSAVFISTSDGAKTGYLNEIGFNVIEKIGSCDSGNTNIYLAYDAQTKVEYIITLGFGGVMFCPYYGSDGNVVIYEED